MEEDDVSFLEIVGDPVQSIYDRQLTSLKTYIDSLPYECETVEQMHDVLEDIVEKLCISAKAGSWPTFTTWDGILQCWLAMLYPMPTSLRAKLVRLYYAICTIPSLEARYIRNWADTLGKLINSKYPGLRKVDPSDLELPWEPLWKMVKRELYPKLPSTDSSRNLVNILFFIAEKARRYFPPSAAQEMLDTFLPKLTQETLLTILPVLTSFLPPSQSRLYLPALFKVWEAFNSSIVDDRLLEFCGDLAEEHVAGTDGELGEYGAPYKDVGIWTQWEWDLITGKCMSSINLPVGLGGSMHNTSTIADTNSKRGVKIKKKINRTNAMAKIFVYSMNVDDEIRNPSAAASEQTGSLAGSRSLTTLEKLVNSAESYFHPSNTGHWTVNLTGLLQRLCAEFISRDKDQGTPTCRVPEARRLTPSIRRAFVELLRTPALLAMFSKDHTSAGYAQGALRTLAMLEPGIIMPELLDRAYGGLEVVNETHRTTGVLSTLSGVTRPLVTGSIWLPGQKHLVPLLELCLPGIDLNDPNKTIYATMFIVNAIQHVAIGDLSAHQAGVPFTGDSAEDRMDVNENVDQLPEDPSRPVLSREEEQSMTRDSTSGFADWTVSLFRRVFALYENLPEEGGKRNVTGGKSEENVLKAIKSMIDVICLHLTEPMFDLVLNLVYGYATTNAKSNSVRAFGGVLSSLSKARPGKTVAKFFPFCAAQIKEELNHGASSVRTTSTHAAAASDTTFHWNLAVLRGCLGNGGIELLKYKPQILELLQLIIEKTKSERGYTSAGRLITRILHTLGSIYPLNSRFVNNSEWEDPAFNGSHNFLWGKLYEAKDVQIDWHVPSAGEVDFIMEIMEAIVTPNLDIVETLLETTSKWDNVARNDFCRYLHAARSVWIGLPTIIKLPKPDNPNTLIEADIEIAEMVGAGIDVNCGFVLTEPNDARYQKVLALRERFGRVAGKAASILRQNTGGEDHSDAVIYATRCIDTYLSSYGITHAELDSLQKNFRQSKELNRSWLRQKNNSRIIYVKRAHLYHMTRVHMHSNFRQRSVLDDQLFLELAELSLSQYTRIRRQAQATLITGTARFVRATKLVMPTLFGALAKGNDPDRMKGALYVLSNKGIAAYALASFEFHEPYLRSLVECQHEEKPSIQKIVSQVTNDSLVHVNEENLNTAGFDSQPIHVAKVVEDFATELSGSDPSRRLLEGTLTTVKVRAVKRRELWYVTVASMLQVATRPTTHWRYTLMILQYMGNMLWRSVPAPADMVRFIATQTVSPQPTIRSAAQRALAHVLYHVKIRTYAQNEEAQWAEEWTSPWKMKIPVGDPADLLKRYHNPSPADYILIDKFATGFLSWSPTIDVYRSPDRVTPPIQWDPSSADALHAVRAAITQPDYIKRLSTLWSQESDKNVSNLDVRMENIVYIKFIAKIFGDILTTEILQEADTLIMDSDKFKQRAGGEFVLGLLRGSKNWSSSSSDKIWSWLGERLPRIFAQIKPDTLAFWEQVFHAQLAYRDPRRNKVLIDWISSIPLEFSGYSAFDMTKSLTMYGALLSSKAFLRHDDVKSYMDLLFENTSTDYAELRQHLCNHLYLIMRNLWQPWYSSTDAFLKACAETNDPLQVRRAIYMDYVTSIISNLPKWREERLPPPRVSQSQYDKIGLSVLQWIWISAYGAPAHLVIPYIVPLLPEILRMSELSDNPDLQAYSSGVLYVLSALTPLSDCVDAILEQFVSSIESSTSWRTRLHGLPAVAIFFFRNLLTLSQPQIDRVLRLLLDCLSNENVEVREMASKVLSSVVRTSQRQSITPLKNKFVGLARKTTLPARSSPEYAGQMRKLHSAILGLCALIESFPYSVEPWMPSLTEVLAPHSTDPPPISTTIRKCASEFKKTHQDTWHKDQYLFDEDQLQSLSTMLVGTSYYA